MYLLPKAVHLLGVVVFLGNIMTGLFWKRHGDRTGSAPLIAHTLRGLIRSDVLFTNPGVLVMTVSGVPGALLAGLPLLRTGWIVWSIAHSVARKARMKLLVSCSLPEDGALLLLAACAVPAAHHPQVAVDARSTEVARTSPSAWHRVMRYIA